MVKIAELLSFHIIAGSISTIVIIILGILIYTRNPKSDINGLLAGMFILLGIYQFIDVVIQYLEESTTGFLNLLRDLGVLVLILAISCGIVASGLIFYGKNIVFLDFKFLTAVGITDLVLFILTIFNEHVVLAEAGHEHSHVEFTRSVFGWLGILGIIAILNLGIGYMLVKTYNTIPERDTEFKLKIMKLLVGLFLIQVVTFSFEISLALPMINEILENVFVHISTHIIAIIGELFVLSAFWNPFKGILTE